jgi:hypothetical protein
VNDTVTPIKTQSEAAPMTFKAKERKKALTSVSAHDVGVLVSWLDFLQKRGFSGITIDVDPEGDVSAFGDKDGKRHHVTETVRKLIAE